MILVLVERIKVLRIVGEGPKRIMVAIGTIVSIR